MGEITIRQVIAGADKLWATGHFARRPRSDPQDVPGESDLRLLHPASMANCVHLDRTWFEPCSPFTDESPKVLSNEAKSI